MADQDWRAAAACLNKDTEIFFPVSDSRSPGLAKEHCRWCPVRMPCLEFALVNGERGVWGGMTEQERREFLAHRNRAEGARGGWVIRRQQVAVMVASKRAKTDEQTRAAAQLAADGATARQVADQLNVHIRTAKRYLAEAREGSVAA